MKRNYTFDSSINQSNWTFPKIGILACRWLPTTTSTAQTGRGEAVLTLYTQIQRKILIRLSGCVKIVRMPCRVNSHLYAQSASLRWNSLCNSPNPTFFIRRTHLPLHSGVHPSRLDFITSAIWKLACYSVFRCNSILLAQYGCQSGGNVFRDRYGIRWACELLWQHLPTICAKHLVRKQIGYLTKYEENLRYIISNFTVEP